MAITVVFFPGLSRSWQRSEGCAFGNRPATDPRRAALPALPSRSSPRSNARGSGSIPSFTHADPDAPVGSRRCGDGWVARDRSPSVTPRPWRNRSRRATAARSEQSRRPGERRRAAGRMQMQRRASCPRARGHVPRQIHDCDAAVLVRRHLAGFLERLEESGHGPLPEFVRRPSWRGSPGVATSREGSCGRPAFA